LYTSTDRATAIAEVVRGLKARGIDPESFGPQDWWVYELRISPDSVLDVSDPANRAELNVSAAALVADNTDETRRIGRQARDAGFQAVFAPSAAAPGSNNLVLFLAAISDTPEVLSSTAVELSAP
jgi:RES domain-containing protein